MKPTLIERGVRYWIKDSLGKTNVIKKESEYFWTNFYIFIAFITIAGLFFLNRKRKSQSTLNKEREQQRVYIEELISNYKKVSSDLITNLPLV